MPLGGDWKLMFKSGGRREQMGRVEIFFSTPGSQARSSALHLRKG